MNYFLTILMLFSPFLTPDDLTVTNNEQKIAVVNRSDFASPFIGKEVIDSDEYQLFLKKIAQDVYVPPVNAQIDKTGKIVSEQIGYMLDKSLFSKKFYEYYYGNEAAELKVPLHPVHPKVDSEILSHIRVQRIGQYVTYFNRRNKQRSHNISLATEAINNHVVFPGETFSFNEVVGKRTRERGYLSAPVIVRGELSEDIGGGICQVSSTLYNAVDHAGLNIVQRYSHSRRVPYVPRGRDATVSWYGPDFVFKNDLNQPILIQAKIYGGSMIVYILSSDAIENEQRKVPGAPVKLPKEIIRNALNL
ncbi:VanW family protein [Halalkalibacter akibai]|uniref:Vancomycin B-type resistance protein VanW n=1 Tax=Halalkalibacter akibai (strain ATCC 43226 / DSM 21942 / CIP 109018 / JCM 9157 / 1139) TaxID=1236973 RepID=W4QX64_HALA3|nr:VanW family protein [Halalkalibacter akibai]GAE35904.1 vancomycin B-type resistance protein VanW [Halalkalibacter akibai JCM 9157]